MLFEPLFQHAATKGNDLAVTDESGRYTFAQFAAAAAGMAWLLSGKTSRDKVGLLLPAGMGFAASFYGTLLAGKTVVPVNFLLGEREVAHILADSGIDTVVTIPQLAGRLKDSPLQVIDLTQQTKPTPEQAAMLLQMPRPTPSEDDLAVLMYTSGTSGLPKGVMLTYGNLQSDVTSAIAHAKLTGHHKFLGILPLFHSTGLLATLLAPVQLGAEVTYVGRFSPAATINAIREHGISIMAAVPSMYAAITKLRDARAEDFATMYATISGGEPLPPAVREAFEAKFKVPMYEGYGLTETIGPIAFNAPGHLKPGSVGRLIPGAEVQITDDDGHAVKAAGDTGEI